MNNVTILIKSFLRKECVDNLITSIRATYKTIPIVVVDDSDKGYNFNYDENIKTYYLPFNSGVSAGRNYGVSKIDTEYFVLLDDDYEFTENTNIEKLLSIIQNSSLDILGGAVQERNGQYDNTYGIFDQNGTQVKCSRRVIAEQQYDKCQFIPNFFIAKTITIKAHGWDPELGAGGEHYAFFFDNQQYFKVGYTNTVSIFHRKSRTLEYSQNQANARENLGAWLKKAQISTFINNNGVVALISPATAKISFCQAVTVPAT